jgi:hypothetical protein
MTKQASNELLPFALEGYAGDVDNASIFSSPAWMAHVAGAALARHGVSRPVACALSRGYSVKLETAGGARWLVKLTGDYLTPSVERLA